GRRGWQQGFLHAGPSRRWGFAGADGLVGSRLQSSCHQTVRCCVRGSRMISDHLASAELPATPGRRNLAVLSTLPRRAAADGLTAVVLALVILLGPALFNGFPFIFADTGGYLARPFEGTLELGRSALYGTFLAAGIPFDFWPNVIIQALITVWIIHLTLP